MLFVIFTNFLILGLLMTGLWAVSVRVKDASIVDIFWGPACAVPALLTFLRVDGASPRALLLTALVVLWAARLGLYLAQRNLGHGEDYRYQKMRAKQGSDEAFVRWSLIYVFWLQCSVAWVVSLPVQVGQFGPDQPLGMLSFLGVAIFTTGLSFETIGDWQLKQFKSDPANKGKLMTTGLWSWTRHPNYFGDSAVWVGLTLIAFESPLGLWTVISPIVMTYFLVAISGKSLTEKHMDAKYPEYADYRRRTSGFFPRPPKSL